MTTHVWSGAPGAYCTRCGNESPDEDMLACRDCRWSGGPHGIDRCVPCILHAAWMDALSSCPPDPMKVAAFNAMLDQHRLPNNGALAQVTENPDR